MASTIKITKVLAQIYYWAKPIKSWQEYNDLYDDYYDLIINKWQLLLIVQ